MEISIEVLAIGLPIIVGILFYFFLTLIKYIRLWRYKPENDKGRRAEEYRRSRGIQTSVSPKGRSIFQVSTATRTGGDKSSVRDTSSSNAKVIRNPFRR